MDFMEQKVDFPFVVSYDGDMRKGNLSNKYRGLTLPVSLKKGEDGFYLVECPLFSGCYTQGRTIEEALKNIREAILLVMEETGNRKIAEFHHRPKEIGWRTITL